MNTTIYFIRHSEVFPKSNLSIIKNSDSNQLMVEKSFLSIDGEAKAERLSNNIELQNIDAIYSSNYDRCLQTAKYFADKNNGLIYVDERFNERKVGNIKNMSVLDFERLQVKNFDYKVTGGESLNEVKKRMTTAVKQVIMHETGNRVIITTHSTALIALLSSWCDVGYNYNNDIILSYEDETIIDGNFTAPMVFKVEFEGLNVISVKLLNIE